MSVGNVAMLLPAKRCKLKIWLSSSVIDDRNSNATLACHGFLRLGTFYTGVGIPEYAPLYFKHKPGLLVSRLDVTIGKSC